MRAINHEQPCLPKIARSAFTLIELLVVIAIIAILAALLLTSLQGAKLASYQAKCISNLKQLALGHSMYINDYGKEFGWVGAPGIPVTPANDPNLTGYWNWEAYMSNCQSVLLCPAAPTPLSAYGAQSIIDNGPSADGTRGTADSAWLYLWRYQPPFQFNGPFTNTYIGSYGYNIQLNTPFYVTPTTTAPGYSSSPNAVQIPSGTPVFADSTSPEIAPYWYDPPSTNLYYGITEADIVDNAFDFGMQALAIPRHGSRPASAAPRNFNVAQRLPGMIDVALYDGHVEKSELENLWSYRWSADWRVPNPHPGRSQ